jgi:hypothetical protein
MMKDEGFLGFKIKGVGFKLKIKGKRLKASRVEGLGSRV